MEAVLFDALVAFQSELSEDRLRAFKLATVRSLKESIISIQREQEKVRGMMDFTRIGKFIEALDQFDQILHSFVHRDTTLSDLSSCIWGPTKSIIEIAKENGFAFDSILETYEKFGGALPLMNEYRQVLQEQPEWRICLAWVYKDLLQFHSDILILFKHRDWAKTFPVNWNDYDEKFEGLLRLLESHRAVLTIASKEQIQDFGFHITQTLDDLARTQQDASQEQQESSAQVSSGTQQQTQLNVPPEIQQKVDDLLMRQQENSEETRSLILEIQEDFRKLIEEYAERKEERRKDEQHKEVVRWLHSPGDARVQYHEKFQRTRSEYPEAGKWFLENEKIKKWIDEDIPDFSGFWVNGKKGAGKTILASTIIDHLVTSKAGWKTSYFYCTQANGLTEPSVLAIMKSLLTQMVDCNRTLLPTMYDKSKRGGHELKEEGKAITLLERFAETDMSQFIVIDGLDELEIADALRIVGILGEIVKKSDEKSQPGKIRVLFFSTDLASIEQYMGTNDRFYEFPLPPRGVAQGIQHFVSKNINALAFHEEEDAEFTKEAICRNSNGVFLYASLVIENLAGQSSDNARMEEVRNNPFPKNCEEVYGRIIDRIFNTPITNRRHDVKRILSWLAYAKRPLTLYELKAALATTITNEGFVRPHDPKDRLPLDIRDICGPLVHIIGDSRVEFSHSLAKEFFLNREEVDAHAMECDLTFHCLNYLSHVCFKKELPAGAREAYAKKGHYAFQDYAISQWPAHLKTVIHNSTDIFDARAEQGYYSNKATTALRNFCQAYKVDPITFKPDQKSLEEEAESDARKECEPFQGLEFYGNLLRTSTHLIGQSKLPPKERNQVSIKELKKVLEENRGVLSKLASALGEDTELSERLRSYYGTNFFKCDRITCPYFYEGFETEEARKSHSNRHERPFQCPVASCSFAQFGFSSNKDRDKHCRTYHPDICELGSAFVPLNRRVVENAKHSCEECGRNFTRKANLDAHMNSAHLGLRPYACSTCSKAFTRNNDRKRHEKLHVRRQR